MTLTPMDIYHLSRDIISGKVKLTRKEMGKVDFVCLCTGCSVGVAYLELIAEEWDCDEAVHNVFRLDQSVINSVV